MTFQAQGAQFGMPQSQPFIGMQSPPPSQMGFRLPVPSVPPSAPPPWATKLFEDMQQIKEKLKCMDKIEKTVNLINTKVSDLDTKMKDMDTRFTANERTCQFISNENEQNKTEMKSAKDDIRDVKKTCNQLEKDAKSMKEKMVDLECRSVRGNLMFYGITERTKDENCEELVKMVVCKEALKITTTDNMVFDQVHRVGAKTGSKVRHTVVKFHYYHERELVRKRSFNHSKALKGENMGIEAQLPKELRNARKPLYPTMKKTNIEGKNIKFVGQNLFIEGEEYVEEKRAPTTNGPLRAS